MSKRLYKFYWDCGRMGHLEGVFVATDEDVKAAIGERLYFGEVLGKHSEIFGPLEEKDLTVLTDDPSIVAIFDENVGSVGYNPLHYLPEEEDE